MFTCSFTKSSTIWYLTAVSKDMFCAVCVQNILENTQYILLLTVQQVFQLITILWHSYLIQTCILPPQRLFMHQNSLSQPTLCDQLHGYACDILFMFFCMCVSFVVLCAKNLAKKDFFRKYLYFSGFFFFFALYYLVRMWDVHSVFVLVPFF